MNWFGYPLNVLDVLESATVMRDYLTDEVVPLFYSSLVLITLIISLCYI
jgi:hypothetical protein